MQIGFNVDLLDLELGLEEPHEVVEDGKSVKKRFLILLFIVWDRFGQCTLWCGSESIGEKIWDGKGAKGEHITKEAKDTRGIEIVCISSICEVWYFPRKK